MIGTMVKTYTMQGSAIAYGNKDLVHNFYLLNIICSTKQSKEAFIIRFQPTDETRPFATKTLVDNEIVINIIEHDDTAEIQINGLLRPIKLFAEREQEYIDNNSTNIGLRVEHYILQESYEV